MKIFLKTEKNFQKTEQIFQKLRKIFPKLSSKNAKTEKYEIFTCFNKLKMCEKKPAFFLSSILDVVVVLVVILVVVLVVAVAVMALGAVNKHKNLRQPLAGLPPWDVGYRVVGAGAGTNYALSGTWNQTAGTFTIAANNSGTDSLIYISAAAAVTANTS